MRRGKRIGKSALYAKPLTLTCTKTIKVATFANGKQMGQTLELPVVWNRATAGTIKSVGCDNIGLLVNGVRGSLKYTDSEYSSWAKNDMVSFTLDLKESGVVNSLKLGSITNYGMAAHKPAKIEIWLSTDNKDYRKVGEQAYTKEEVFREGTFKEDIGFSIGEKGRYIRVVAYGVGNCPITHVRPGQEARIYFDEIIVE